MVPSSPCQICDEVSQRAFVSCRSCKYECCQDCFQTYLLNCDLEPTCMNPDCRVPILYEVLLRSVDREWLNEEYRAHRTLLLAKIEAGRMQETQAASTAYLTALSVVSQEGSVAWRIVEVAKTCVIKYGKGYEGFDFVLGTVTQTAAGLIIGCPVTNCRGFASNFKCRLCHCSVCEYCHKVLYTGHKCDPKEVASIKAVYGGSKPCPKCAAPISRISGCDQMFCVCCCTTFDWGTMHILDNVRLHNPHYFEWMSSKKQEHLNISRISAQDPSVCEEYITYEKLMGCFDNRTVREARVIRGKLSSIKDVLDPLPSPAHYYVALENFRFQILDVRATSGNHANLQPLDNTDLRVQLQVDEISEQEMHEQLYERDLNYRRSMAYRNVYFMVYETAIILFDNVVAYTCRFSLSKEYRKMRLDTFLFQIYSQFQMLLMMANECLNYNDAVFGPDKRFVKFQRHPYSQMREKVEEEPEPAPVEAPLEQWEVWEREAGGKRIEYETLYKLKTKIQNRRS